ncbi:uncharacterized protein LOC135272730 isoform X1 [Aotus nancymaae]|uniref:uncharacterized protein LOC135272716 isoform X1 n=1 Tax=Aotus nancymaae TaxID=37293 RepID=UPI0030FE328F
MPGEVRLAATWECVSPQQHDCTSFCHPVGGELSAELGICQCHKYVSAEELCDAQCLAQALQLSLAWGPSRELILSVKNEAGDSIQMEVSSTLSPDQLFQGSASIHLVQFSPRGIFGFIISRADVLDSFLLGKWRRRHQTQAFPENVGGVGHGCILLARAKHGSCRAHLQVLGNVSAVSQVLWRGESGRGHRRSQRRDLSMERDQQGREAGGANR